MSEGVNLIEQGLVLMGAGMGVVGLFLSLMVVVMYVSSFLLKKFEKERPPDGGEGPHGSKDELAEIAVAIAAVKAHMRI
jgi:sodium pump decarboxylase gamma subunit